MEKAPGSRDDDQQAAGDRRIISVSFTSIEKYCTNRTFHLDSFLSYVTFSKSNEDIQYSIS
jgi:hypothetical protein